MIASALRRVLGSMTASEVRSADHTIALLKRVIDDDVARNGYSVRDIAANFASCIVWK